ncbi:S8 family serine peptidase [Streptomyces fructofermentans]|uniref:Peptidase n=1 Tax=Streptomyces fructofermentans TaxID=152141 RepID=A0A918U3A9_9ACTN|nr:S8 family serine peptidase [Streptomyces fructofermentans]GGX85365.1 peptidase [Streptomyces fructofermentans]
MRRIRLVAAISTGLALAAGTVAPVSARTGAAPTAQAEAPAPAALGTVRLITGDKVTVATGADGRHIASVVPGAGRRDVLFRTYEQDGNLTVLPSDAGDLVAAGRLDRELFDVTALLAQGYDEAHSDALPLIVSGAEGVAESAVRRLTGLAEEGSRVRRLDSIGAHSVRVAEDDLDRFWSRIVPADGRMNASRVAGTPRVWLDGRVGAVLDRSVAQIEAPAVWKAGYRGESVKVAVLDTGADASHPDLAGRIVESRDFSGSSGTGDGFGHGTHVASIVGGSGAASGGTRKGVAPGADLLVGKVLGDDGYGSESQVIAGMEWAADSGARVVNMSLGSEGSSDGTDPMSLALNELTERTGTLFVVAAGNSGELGTGTIGSPGAADAALTVGAVDRDDTLAPFSSRGPRVGDDAVKPDVTAPGVGIVAARAAGTTMGSPVDAHYVSASGTSMATPHVAGAAALLAQRHPDWSAARLKDALVSTARTVTGQKVAEQGGGRIDAAAAVLGPVTATGTVSLGPFEAGDDGTRTKTLRYTNTSDAEVALTLTAELATSGGREPAEGAVRIGSGSVRVPAGGTAEVPLSVDPARVQQGDYYGYVTAASADGKFSVHTTVSLVVQDPTHRITVKTIDHEGKQIEALPTIWGANGFVAYTGTEPAVAEVEEGNYQLDYSSLDPAADGQELRHVVLPEVKVTKDMSVTLDARRTTLVDIRTPRPARQQGVLSYQTYRRIDGHGLLAGTMYFDIARRLYVSPTSEVTDGEFEFASRWQLVAPLLEADVSGGGGALDAYYMPASPLLAEGGTRLAAVDAGDASKPSFTRARGKLAVLTNKEGVFEQDVIQRAAAAGVRGVVLVHFSDNAWTRWHPSGERWGVPTIRINAREGAALLKRIGRGSTSVAFTSTARSPYLYDVMQVSSQRIPEKVVHTVSPRNSAVVRTRYADNGGSPWASEQRFGRRPYQDTAWLQYTRYVPTGFERTEYVSSGDTDWLHLVHHETTFDVDMPLAAGMKDTPRTYRAGERARDTWQGAVVRPSIPRGTANPSVRSGDVLELRIPEFTDSESGHWSRTTVAGGGIGTSAGKKAAQGDSASAVLHRDGRKVGEADGAWGDFEVPSGAADFRLDLTTSRVSGEWKYATRTDTSWAFRSGTTDRATELPLLQLDYAVPVDARNAVDSGRKHTVGLTVRAQDSLPAPRGVRVEVEVSYDDGASWNRAGVTARGGNTFDAKVERPSKVRGDAYVTLRVTARDDAGSSVRQTVRRAYLQHG